MKAQRLLLIVALAMPCSLAAASGPVSPATPLELAEDGIAKSAAAGSDLRISGVQISVCLTSDVRVNFWDPLKIVTATNNYAGTSENQFYSTDGGKTWGQDPGLVRAVHQRRGHLVDAGEDQRPGLAQRPVPSEAGGR